MLHAGAKAARVDQLGERLDGVAQPGGPRGREPRPVRGHRDAMGVAGRALAVQLDPGTEIRGAGVRLDGELRAADRADGVAQPGGRGEIRVARAGAEHDRQLVAQREAAGEPRGAPRCGKQRRKLGVPAGARHARSLASERRPEYSPVRLAARASRACKTRNARSRKAA